MKHELNTSVILETTRLAFAGEMSFPQSIAALAGIGVERYSVDLARLERVCHGTGGDSIVEPVPLDDSPKIASQWSPEAVATAVRTIQRQQLAYPQFLRIVMQAGCASYHVFINGRKVIYCSRFGDTHVELFPPQP